MKCEYCGGNLSIEDIKCPHCDAPNPFYEAHRRDMNRFKRDYEKTRDEVVSSNKRYTRKAAIATIITVLLLLCIVAIIINANMWEINYEREVRFHKKHQADYVKQMAQYEADKDYLAMAAIMANCYYYVPGSDMEEYTDVGLAAEKYASILKQIGLCIDGSSFYTASELAKNLASRLNELYECRERYESRLNETSRYKENHLQTIDDIIEETYLLMNVYLGIDYDVLYELPELTAAKRQVVIEEAIMEVSEYE